MNRRKEKPLQLWDTRQAKAPIHFELIPEHKVKLHPLEPYWGLSESMGSGIWKGMEQGVSNIKKLDLGFQFFHKEFRLNQPTM